MLRTLADPFVIPVALSRGEPATGADLFDIEEQLYPELCLIEQVLQGWAGRVEGIGALLEHDRIPVEIMDSGR